MWSGGVNWPCLSLQLVRLQRNGSHSTRVLLALDQGHWRLQESQHNTALYAAAAPIAPGLEVAHGAVKDLCHSLLSAPLLQLRL